MIYICAFISGWWASFCCCEGFFVDIVVNPGQAISPTNCYWRTQKLCLCLSIKIMILRLNYRFRPKKAHSSSNLLIYIEIWRKNYQAYCCFCCCFLFNQHFVVYTRRSDPSFCTEHIHNTHTTYTFAGINISNQFMCLGRFGVDNSASFFFFKLCNKNVYFNESEKNMQWIYMYFVD